jgi:hypothetical protein
MWVARVLKRPDEYRGSQAALAVDRFQEAPIRNVNLPDWHGLCGWLPLFGKSYSPHTGCETTGDDSDVGGDADSGKPVADFPSERDFWTVSSIDREERLGRSVGVACHENGRRKFMKAMTCLTSWK